MTTREYNKRMKNFWPGNPVTKSMKTKLIICPKCQNANESEKCSCDRASGSSPAPGSDFMYALPYSSLQEIHALVGMVCGSHMNLPVRMIRKAHQVHSLMLNLKTERK